MLNLNGRPVNVLASPVGATGDYLIILGNDDELVDDMALFQLSESLKELGWPGLGLVDLIDGTNTVHIRRLYAGPLRAKR